MTLFVVTVGEQTNYPLMVAQEANGALSVSQENTPHHLELLLQTLASIVVLANYKPASV